jgi:Fe-S oxidoreductase
MMEWIAEIASKCVKCNYCSVCPTYRVDGWESVSPRGKIQILRDLTGKNYKLDAKIVKDFYKCSVCGLCEVKCMVDLPLIDFWEEVRAELVKNGYAPLSVHKKLRDATYRDFNPYGGLQEERGEWLEVETSEDSEVLYFAGCTASFRLQNLAKSTTELLEKLGVKFQYAGKDEVCCGSPFIRTGQLDIAERLFEKNFKTWQKMGIKKIITSCPGCFRTIAKDYPKFAEKRGYKFDIEVMHTISLLDEKMNNMKGDAGIAATYHDPCHLGRHMGIYEEPRRVIRKLGIKLIEMERNREEALCCGAGGGLRSQFKEISFEIGRERVEEAMKTGTEYLITCCPFCEYHLSKSANKLGNKIKVLDLVELANELLKI